MCKTADLPNSNTSHAQLDYTGSQLGNLQVPQLIFEYCIHHTCFYTAMSQVKTRTADIWHPQHASVASVHDKPTLISPLPAKTREMVSTVRKAASMHASCLYAR
jgi:hypothetical protein